MQSPDVLTITELPVKRRYGSRRLKNAVLRPVRVGRPISASKRPKKAKKPLVSRLIKKCDSAFSIYMRTKYSINGTCFCFTCNHPMPIKGAQNGHYVSRSVKILRWHEDNARPQCFGCNVMHGGRPIDFRENLIAEIGEDRVKQLESRRKELFRPSREYLLELISDYTARLAMLK